jgi:type 1 glutamine amidotransferase
MKPILILLITGVQDLPYHHWEKTTPVLKQYVEAGGKAQLKVIDNPATITKETLKGAKGLILHYNGPRWGATAEKAVEEFVRKGGGFVSLHGVSYGPLFGQVFEKRWRPGPDNGWPAYGDLLGATWKVENIGHARRGPFKLKWIAPQHPIARGLDPEFATDDELYHKLDLKAGIEVLATAWSDPKVGGTGKDEPMVWVGKFGKGKIVHIPLGHDDRAMGFPGFRDAFTRSVMWSAGALR